MNTRKSAWPVATLGSISEQIDYGHTASAIETPVGPKLLRITDIQNGHVNWNKVPYCEATEQEVNQCRLRPGDIVFARTGATTGKSFLIADCPKNAIFASYLIRVRPGPSVDPRFLAHFFDTPDYWSQIKKHARGAGQPGVNATNLKSISTPLPPLPVQKRIADILDKADAIRRKRHEAETEFSHLPSSAFLEFFGDPLANPFAWSMETLGTVVESEGRSLKRGPFGGTLKKEIFVDEGYKVYEQKHAISGDFSLGSYFIDEEKFLEMEPFAIKPGDLIVSCSGTMGRVAIVPENARPGIINQALLRITPNKNKVSSQYLKLLLETESVQRRLYGISRGSGLKNFPPMEEVRALPVPVPPAGRLAQFQRYLDRVNLAYINFAIASQDGDCLFNSLVQRSFRGEL